MPNGLLGGLLVVEMGTFPSLVEAAPWTWLTESLDPGFLSTGEHFAHW